MGQCGAGAYSMCGLSRTENRGGGGGHSGLAACNLDSVCYLRDKVPGCVCQFGGGGGLWPM